MSTKYNEERNQLLKRFQQAAEVTMVTSYPSWSQGDCLAFEQLMAKVKKDIRQRKVTDLPKVLHRSVNVLEALTVTPELERLRTKTVEAQQEGWKVVQLSVLEELSKVIAQWDSRSRLEKIHKLREKKNSN